MIFSLFRRRREEDAVEALYRRVASAGRAPPLFLDHGVPDTAEGRFEVLALHVILVVRRLRSLPPPAADVAQDLVDVTFRELDRSLRQMGVGDISVPKRIKALAQAFYGRVRVYDHGLDTLAAGGSEEALLAALARHLVRAGHPATGLAAYIRRADETLAKRGVADILDSDHLFPDPESERGKTLMAQLREPPLHRLVAAEDVPLEGLDVIVEATQEERNELASFLGLPQIGRLVGTFHVKGSPQRLTVTGQVEASVTQVCVVSLDPFETAVSEGVAVAFADPAAAAASSREGRVSVTSSREPPDEIVGGRIDLGALAAEFLALGLDPYPRKPGVTFSFSTQHEAGPSPFAALTKIKFDKSAGG